MIEMVNVETDTASIRMTGSDGSKKHKFEGLVKVFFNILPIKIGVQQVGNDRASIVYAMPLHFKKMWENRLGLRNTLVGEITLKSYRVKSAKKWARRGAIS
ncbi:uncharacterized protein EV154DRAFT_489046 [Mucor mucedo]|uniref:uncharacterized protein n=1 Tax=Mucor mucedo TaxID=29922 RepID=UPI0022208731|nr:uncharacterized protein EV154DRAFT_489046 [Mucor mucedo]KAI7863555.1 hypothetical protein EV154DRAFT_489046 [Mucor mucedo]